MSSTLRRASSPHSPPLQPLVLAAMLGGGTALLARAIRTNGPFRLDADVRDQIHRRVPPRARSALAPLFLLGLPGGYITIAHATALYLRRRRLAGGPAIVTSAWLGWLVHRGVKIVYERERPRIPRVRQRMDSYPSGHTTGTTALAVTMSLVLHRRDLLSARTAMVIGAGAPLVMGAYRIIDDEHWATDVLGGWLLGGSIAVLCNAFLADARGPAIRRARRMTVGQAARG